MPLACAQPKSFTCHVTHPDWESFSALTDGSRWHRVDCSFKVRVLVLQSDAAPASPKGRLVTENPALRVLGFIRSTTEHGVCRNIGVTGTRGCH